MKIEFWKIHELQFMINCEKDLRKLVKRTPLDFNRFSELAEKVGEVEYLNFRKMISLNWSELDEPDDLLGISKIDLLYMKDTVIQLEHNGDVSKEVHLFDDITTLHRIIKDDSIHDNYYLFMRLN